jgi:hypothetical protein
MSGETEVLRENLPQCPFVHHKAHMTLPMLGPGCRGGKPSTNRLSCGTAYCSTYLLSHYLVRVLDYRFRDPGFDSRALPEREKKSSGSGTGSTQPREYN